MNRLFVSSILAFVILVSGFTGAFYFNPNNAYQPVQLNNLKVIRNVVVNPMSVVINNVIPTSPAPVMTGFAQDITFTINSFNNAQHEVTAIFTTNQPIFGVTQYRQHLSNAPRGQSTRAIYYGQNEILQGPITLQVCNNRGQNCILSQPYNLN